MKDDFFNNDERLYLEMMQGNIERMASNSANCKTWLVTITAGFMAISCGFEALNWWLLLTLFPTAMFWYLDVFYFSLERGMRNRQRDFLIIKTTGGNNYMQALFNFKPLNIENDDEVNGFVKTSGLWKTKSVLPFYLTMTVVIIVITVVINRDSICSFLSLLFHNCGLQINYF